MSLVDVRSRTGDVVPAWITPDGQYRMLVSIPGKPAYASTSPWAGSRYPVIDRKDYKDFTFRRTRTALPIFDQQQEGSCTCNALLRAYHKARLDSGQADTMLSRAFLYALVNGGRDAGSDPSEAVSRLVDTGVCSEATVPYRFLVQSQLPGTAFDEAQRYRADPAGIFTCANFDEAVNAAIYGCHLAMTVFVAGDWNTLDSDGCPPAVAGTGNHDMNGGDALTMSSRGEPLIEMDQSWGVAWCNAGRCNLRREHFDNQPYLQIYAVKFPGIDPMDPGLPPGLL